MSGITLYWYDFETFGVDPRRNWPAQFAGVRTTESLEPVGDPLVQFCTPPQDRLPQPEACLVTGITPAKASGEGLCEAEFFHRINEQLAIPGTCGCGYNNIRFDDEVIRNGLYRNFFDPYAREWQNRNSRWDLIDSVRLTQALRPEGIEWPRHADGSPSFRLEELTRENGIGHDSAHDALSDVYATIALARLIRERQPRLFDYIFSRRQKNACRNSLRIGNPEPVLHVSGMYSSARGCLALVAPLMDHPWNKNGVIVYDLSQDPTALIECSSEEIRRRLFTPREELDPETERIHLKTVHLNKCPVIAPRNVLRAADAERLGIDPDRCQQNLQRLQQCSDLPSRLARVYEPQKTEDVTDPDLMLYSGGFFGDRDRRLFESIRNTSAQYLCGMESGADDPRVAEMLFRYRARNFPESLSAEEKDRWESHRISRIQQGDGEDEPGLKDYRAQLDSLRQQHRSDPRALEILAQLDQWADCLTGSGSIPS